MIKLKDFLLGLLAISALPAVLSVAFYLATSTPDVIFSYSTKQCVRVINADGTDGDCNHLPTRYNHIWGK